jgi:hypothetical protein
MDGLQPLAVMPSTGRWARSAPALAWVRERLTTTPGRLALASAAVIVGAVCFGVVAGTAGRSRERAAQAVRTETEPLLVEAVRLYAALSDANATATTTFLTGGLEPPARRARYLEDLRTASESLAKLTRELGTSASALKAVATIGDQLPLYSGFVESARADNRQGLPVGAAYLRRASELLTSSILPAADQLSATEAKRLSNDYSSGTATTTLIVFVVVAAVSLALLCCAQWYIARISHRIFNVPMLAATLVLAAVSIWGLVGLIGEQNALATAQRNGSDSVEVLSATRILLSRAQSDESLTLVARGGDEQHPADFDAALRALGPGADANGLVGEVAVLARRTGTSAVASKLASTLASYRAQHARIDSLQRAGLITPAINVAVGSAASGDSPADRLSANLNDQIAAAQKRFEHAAADSTSALAGLSLAGPVLTVLVAALALLGLRQRINEYR